MTNSSFLLLLFYIFIISSVSPFTDLDALIKLKSSLTSPTGLHDWNSSSSHCYFSGVVCDPDFRVISLNISFRLLQGSIAPEIGLLTKLVNLTMSSNNLSGVLPLEFANLTSLKLLNVSNNRLCGEFSEFIAGALVELQFLQTDIFLLATGTLPAELVKLKKLRHLHLGGNFFSGEIPNTYSQIMSLEYLGLNGNSHSGKIPSTLGRLSNLQELYLGYFNLYQGGIPVEFGELRSLRRLDLGSCNLSGEIPGSLEVLQLWENNFTLGLPEKLGRSGSLVKLDLTSNHLTGMIPRGLCYGGRLQTLILMNNFFIGPIPEELGECKSLTRVRLAKNFLNGPIPAGMFNLPLVDFLELNDNYFSGELPEKMSGDVLELMVLANNQLTGKIPAAIGNFSNLQTLSFELNQISGRIPPEIGDLKFLSKINISHNSILGEIPVALSRCSHLTLLDLSGNNLSGAIPKQIARLKVLNILNLSSNQLVGQVPKNVGAMKLSVLDLSYNNLSGPIQFTVFNETSFAGNPNLCDPLMQTLCDPALGRDQHLGNKSLAKLLMIAILSPVCAILVSLFVFLNIKKFLKRKQSLEAWKLTAFQRLEFTVEDVLECLKEENIIGQGGAGTVYHGSMPDGLDVAIKQLTGRSSGKSDNGFSAEIQTLGKIRHRNIVRLLGYVSNKDTNLLLYEYMPNGSLGELLRGSKGSHFGWSMRYRVAVEAAKGLCYLHHDCSPLIIHRDVKSNNILLDSDFEAHVADFGLAKFLTDAGASEGMSSIAGSYGYIAPEAVLSVVDRRLTKDNLSGVVNLFKVAILCAEESSDARPTMREVVHMLTNPPPSSRKILALTENTKQQFEQIPDKNIASWSIRNYAYA
ncbi:hypothetical protein GIB67_015795 [Kingdonia uniflora]|uniref:non-specific serine/threonine protein kinase n=1 Tax=Kingdonia uniflora TaxID=39325 RepID=A0A7J7NUR5_9MAGN|nr:hypothetical protein GIB67_015795 [Kingdonia uniflora]